MNAHINLVYKSSNYHYIAKAVEAVSYVSQLEAPSKQLNSAEYEYLIK